jgi:hypothetical protein
MSAAARGTASDYSKGPLRRLENLGSPRTVLAGVAVLGAVLLLVAELSPLYTVVVGSLETPRRSVSGGSSHGWALAVVAAAALMMTFVALRGARAAAGALVALGAVTLVVALAIDLPDTRRSGSLREAVAFEKARAKAGRGLGLELAGALCLLVSGAGLLRAGASAGPRRSRGATADARTATERAAERAARTASGAVSRKP